MEIEVDDDLLRTVASGGQMDYGLWPALSQGIITRLDKIVHNDFPIPKLPPPNQHIYAPGQLHPRLLSPLPSSSIDPPSSRPSSQDADKENQPTIPNPTLASRPAVADSNAAATTSAAPPPPPPQPAPNSLPAQIEAMVVEINAVLSSFPKYPPHTIQRLAELVLEPRRHYRHLASYLHAVDRVVHVTSGANVYPLPPAIPDASAMTLLSSGGPNGSGGPHDPAAAVSWGNSTNSVASTVGTDEALGGALLTPIPWLTRRPSPGSASPASSNGGGGPAEIRTEHTETIDGPNGVGSIETVSVSVNGIPSMGARNNNGGSGSNSPSPSSAGPGPGSNSNSVATRGITQGELLRQEQEQGVVPALQIARQAEEAHHAAALRAAAAAGPGGGPNHSPEKQHAAAAAAAAAGANSQSHHHLSGSAAAEDLEGEGEEEEEMPHARGPEEIGVDDLGPQSVTTSFVGPGIEMQGIDVEAAVGRRAEPRDNTPPPAVEEDVAVEEAPPASEAENAAADDDAASETSTTSHAKRDANEELEGVASKKIKEGEGDVVTAGEATGPQAEEESKEAAAAGKSAEKPAEEEQAKKDDESTAEAGTTTSEDPKTE
ncbi:hypothetical protein CPLU01_08165 [Colletotrichum plurivorum]|uniref:Protein phosphatase 4 core regulatory subunit R2 n=1 Tax=Colletotrichum plurivorum TaxID=2175906 RepID=A0A8H6KE24_9PEZI|nr:hypothetical protein CPLU01_08165 [Colletotrichum plurivorum]